MTQTRPFRPRWAAAAAVAAIAFGAVTVVVGGKTLFATPADAARAIVPFVLWFNFIAGFFYIVAGVGLLLWRPWSAILSAAIAVATLSVFAAFGVRILLGGPFEARTVGAMTVRSLFWIGLTLGARRARV